MQSIRKIRALAGFASVVGLLLLSGVSSAQTTTGGLTPENLVKMFDSFAPLIMLIMGLAVTRFPAFAKIPNDIIPWLNAVLYIIGKLAVGTAHAGVLGAIGSTLGIAGTIAYGAVMSALTSVLYDKFGKPGLDHVWPKP